MKNDELTRRAFLKQALTTCSVCSLAMLDGTLMFPAPNKNPFMREAKYYDKQAEKKVICKLCPHECRVADLERGTCGVRENQGGMYYTLVYGNPCSAHIDPIEKKPIFHYYPTTRALSIATAGCNFVCKFCQNWEISQKRPEQVKSYKFFPREVINLARQRNCKTVAHTYTEPVIFFEYMLDCAIEGKKWGVPNVMISNGYIQEKPMRELCKYLGAVKIDLKAFTEKFYKEMCDGTLKPVLDVLLVLKDEGIWYEIVVLLIPTLNDSKQEINAMTKWIIKELGPDVPVHFSRYYPTFMLKNIPPTPPETLHRARKIAMDNGVKFAYVGNLISDAENTYCPSCGKLLIERMRYAVSVVGMKKNRCKYCSEIIPGVF
ncbi:MAG: AmmeMemoRadiSam system radical SAM enzyme [Candidatus Aminicenantes bacterium]|nr:AmmeMemoRadiSam system radical SAM enzyme [Candidatus Aminicenantes bacterium]NIM79670.1 AmmeMemoRadiSam system radical SAM enzyme [Candidatus Aminicenantes bacterium]NIN18996.1 AmmeMemoRadiSam system radical SAM enzyme [Candidatus Aminicenantes bacterium]NIN42898.1 AmmeMemoRadiSam system radical SAM enzyme [Candidatus Aminicenantes bacterium]NIN85635.1 AmmeMemoRadiSam system radical SAM enzyme [Candidatus Aminicenantes bacterium]